MVRIVQKVIIGVPVFLILAAYFASCSPILKGTSTPKTMAEDTRWQKLVLPDMAAQVISKKESGELERTMDARATARISNQVNALVPPDEIVLDMAVSDLDGNSKKEILAIIARSGAKHGRRLLIVSLEDEKAASIWKDIDLNEINPWRIRTGDIDGDGNTDVLVGVYKKTRFDPKMDNRLFVYDWDGDDLFPKWLGSSLSLPFYDFAVGDVDGKRGEELVSLEYLKDGGSRLMIYKWSGFGFLGEWEARSSQTIKSVLLCDLDGDGEEEILIDR